MIDVVIVAAGIASRLKPYSVDRPKCYMELEPGVTILDFILERIKQAKLTRIIIVTRPQFKKMFEDKLKGEAEVIETDIDDFGNLYSVSLALKHLKSDSFLLLMSDHIFEQSILDDILSHDSETAFTVCLDRKPSHADAVEGLKLIIKDRLVVYTSKSVSPRYGIDTGVIFCRSNSRMYIIKAIDEYGPRATIADALNLAAAEYQVDYIDVTGRLWKDIDTPEDLVKARDIYWKIRRRDLSAIEEGFISRYVYKPISTRISTSIYRSSLSYKPAFVWMIILSPLIIGLIADYALILEEFVIGSLIIQLVAIMVEVKDEIEFLSIKSIATAKKSYLGMIIDSIVGICIASGLVLSSDITRGPLLILALLATSNIAFIGYIVNHIENLGVKIRLFEKIPVTRDTIFFIVSITIILSSPIYGLYYLAITPILCMCYYIIRLYKVKLRIIPREVRKPEPEIIIEKKKIVRDIENIISNLIKLFTSLLIINMISPVFSSISIISFDSITLTSDHIVSFITLIAIIFFGYKILISLKILVDIVTVKLIIKLGITETTLKHIQSDLIYISLAIIAWIYIPPQLYSIPYIGEHISRIARLIIFIFFLLIFYDLAKTVYNTFEDIYRKIIRRISEKLYESIG